MGYYAKMSDDEKKWRQRDDARTLAEAEQIKADKERYKGAIQGAKEIAQERIDEAKSIIKVAGMKTPKTPTGKSPAQPFNKRGYHNPATLGRL